MPCETSRVGHRVRWLAIAGVAVVLSACVALLVTASPWLTTTVVPEVPAGTFIAWLALVLLPLLVLLVFEGPGAHPPTVAERGPRAAVRAALALAAVWGFVSWALAGNPRFEFVAAPGRLCVWVVFTAALPVATLAGAVGLLVSRMGRRTNADVNRSPDGS